MNIFRVFHPPKLCKELIVTYFVYVFHVVTLFILLIPIYHAVVFSNFKLQRFYVALGPVHTSNFT